MFLGSKSPKSVCSMPRSWVPKAGTHGPGCSRTQGQVSFDLGETAQE